MTKYHSLSGSHDRTLVSHSSGSQEAAMEVLAPWLSSEASLPDRQTAFFPPRPTWARLLWACLPGVSVCLSTLPLLRRTPVITN